MKKKKKIQGENFLDIPFDKFDGFEVNGCVTTHAKGCKDNGDCKKLGCYTEQNNDNPEFFTVYGHYKPGPDFGIEALFDLMYEDEANKLAEVLELYRIALDALTWQSMVDADRSVATRKGYTLIAYDKVRAFLKKAKVPGYK